MLVDLVRIQTRDGVALDGALQRPAETSPRLAPLDAAILVHGTGSNFYQSTLLELLADRFAAAGVAALRVNTRGHDGISTAVTQRGGRRLGAAFETVDDCRHDLAGWLAFARSRVGPRVGVMGHSLGAVKTLFAAAHESEFDPSLIVAVSPPRLSYSAFRASSRRDEFLQTFERAQGLVDAGQPNALIEVDIPLPMIISAAGYVDKYGPDERIDFTPLVERIACPILFVFGGSEVGSNVAFQGLPTTLRSLRPSRYGREVAEIAEADHFYSGKRTELCDLIFDRLEPLVNRDRPIG